jgi:hypothetical protein
MTAVTTTTPLEWVGDPMVLVYAVRYALTSHGSHVPELLRQTLAANSAQLPPAARRAISRDIQAWLDADDGYAPATERATWIRAHQAIQVRRAQPNVSRKDLHR